MESAPPESIKKLLIIHMGYFMALALFAVMAIALVYFKILPPVITTYKGEIILGAALLVIIAFLISKLLYKRKLKNINNSNHDLSQKLNLLTAANITRWIILEIAAGITVILFLLTGQVDILILVIAMLVILFLSRPTAINVAGDLEIRESDILNLQN